MESTIVRLYETYIKYPRVSTDSRNIPVDSIFFALKGESFNGNDFALDALKKGAKLAVVDDPGLKQDEKLFFVEDVLAALQQLALYHRKMLGLRVIAITGTNGKTTTKELVQRVLKQKYNSKATQGNLNNHIGVPLTLLSMTKEIEFAVVEMGANHIGEIAQLCEIARPDFGLITNIGKAHLEGFGSLEGVKTAKTELYNFIRKNDGIVFINSDNEVLLEAGNNIRSVTYGSGKEAYCSGEIVERFPYVNLEFESAGAKYALDSKLLGEYNFENIMAAVCMGKYFNVSVNNIIKAIETYQPANSRSQVIETENNLIILDAYNANPSSMKAAIDNFQTGDYKNKVLILGDMMELGKDSEKEHQNILENVETIGFKDVFLVGQLFMKARSSIKYDCFESSDKFLEYLQKHPLKGKTILLKGSRKVQLEKVVNAL